MQYFGDLGVADHFCQPVGAQQEAVAVFKSQIVDVGLNFAATLADASRQDVPESMPRHLIRADLARVGEGLCIGVVARQAV